MDDYPVVGRCKICGRVVPGYRKHPPSGECAGDCPRCGRPLHLTGVGPYVFQNIVRLEEPEACAFMRSLETQREVEACLRLEMVGLRRDSVFLAGIGRYIELDDDPTLARQRLYRNGRDLGKIKAEIMADLDNPGIRSMYVGLMVAGEKGWPPEQAARFAAAQRRARTQMEAEEDTRALERLARGRRAVA
jgi:hypothetical protein